MKKLRIMAALLLTAVILAGCQKEENKKPASEPAADRQEEQEPTDGFAYEEKDYGIVLTKYYGKDDKVEIPETIGSQVVIGLETTLFEDCEKLTSVRIPVTVEIIHGGIFSKFPDVIIEGYENTKSEEIAYNEQCEFKSLGRYTGGVRYVEIYDSETKGIMNCIRLENGDVGKEGEYSEGASFSVKDDTAVLTLENYNGGMIEAGGYGSLVIKLTEGSVNNITAGDENEGISVQGDLTIEGNGSLSIKAGDLGSGMGIWAWGELTVQDRVHMFVKSGARERRPTYPMAARSIRISNSGVELQAGKTGVGSMAIYAMGYLDSENEGRINLEGCHIAEGGNVVDIIENYEGVEYRIGQSVSRQPGLAYDETADAINGAAEYVRIEPDAN